jgi:hypothetical protein
VPTHFVEVAALVTDHACADGRVVRGRSLAPFEWTASLRPRGDRRRPAGANRATLPIGAGRAGLRAGGGPPLVG